MSKPRKPKPLANVLYHVRTKDGCTIHLMDWEHAARRLATDGHYEVYRLDRAKGTQIRIQ